MITSVNLNTIPFLSSTDATRASMSAKQIIQALTSRNTEIPYVIGSDYDYLKKFSRLGITIAKDDGKVLYKNNETIIVQYYNLNIVQDYYIPPIRKTHSIFGSTLKFSLNKNDEFKKGDTIANYDCFLNGIPSYGYNCFSCYMPFFGFNHEDSAIVSEDFCNKAQVQFIDKVYLPIYEYTLLQKIYDDVNNSYTYFPAVGQKLKEDIICCLITPKDTLVSNSSDPKYKVQQALKNMTLSNLLSLQSFENNKFMLDKQKSKLENGYISGFKIHRIRNPKHPVQMIDPELKNCLDGLYNIYAKLIIDVFNDLKHQFSLSVVNSLIKKYYAYQDNTKITQNKNIDIKNAIYLLEFEISKTDNTHIGDKIANRFANKGVISLIIPNELRPIAKESNIPIDIIFNPFSVFSRMNLGQVLEGIISKSVMKCDNYIKQNPNGNIEHELEILNESIIKQIDIEYANRIQTEIINKMKHDKLFKQKFSEDVCSSNLFIEAPCFAEIDISKLLESSQISYKEPVILKKELLKYMKQKLKVDVPFLNEDIEIPNIFCAPIYIQKLYKLSAKLLNARDFGPVKAITKQPVKGRAKSGGSRIGQMELEAILAAGCDTTIKELMSVKSDWSAGKEDLLRQLILNGEYHLPNDREIKSRTKTVVDIQLQFLKS